MTPKDARTAGVVSCLIGLLIMVAAARHAGIPYWMVYPGVGVILLGWAFFAYSIARNVVLARARAKDAKG